MRFDDYRQDARVAFRRLRRSPGFAISAVLTLGVAIGAATATWSAVQAVLLNALPFFEPERLVMITRSGDVSVPDGKDWRPATPSLESLALYLASWDYDLIDPSSGSEPVRLRGAVVEPEIFRVLGVEPILGRTLIDSDDRAGAPRVAVLSESAWRTQFAASLEVVGREVTLSGEPATIVGVMSERADFLDGGWDIYTPVGTSVASFVNERGTNNFDAIGRLAGGAPAEARLAEATRELRAVSERLEREFPNSNRGKIVVPMPLLDFRVGPVRGSLWVVFGAVCALTAMAALAVGSMLLARALGRRSEIDIRLALGAARGAVARLFFFEAAMVAAAAAALGAVLAWVGLPVLIALAPVDLPRADAISFDGGALAFGIGCAAACALIFGPLPLVQLRRRGGDGGGGGGSSVVSGQRTIGDRRRRVLQSGLVVAQVAIACSLLAGALLLVRSFERLRSVPLGFDPEGVLAASLVLPEARYADPALQTRTFAAIVDGLSRIPGVSAAGSIITPPLEPRGGIGSAIEVAGYQRAPDERMGARTRMVSGRAFEALGLRMVNGRGFDSRDHAGGDRVAIVNQAFVTRYLAHLPPGEVLGARVARLRWTPEPEWMTVVGVVEDLKGRTLRAGDDAVIYSPYEQRGSSWQRWGTLLVKTPVMASGSAQALERSVRAAVAAVDPALTLEFFTLSNRVQAASAPDRFNAFALAGFGGLSLLLAIQALYGLLAQIVADRRRELGVRAALGAAPGQLARSVVGRSGAWAALGLLCGGAVIVALSSVLRTLLFEVGPFDAWALGGSLTLVAAGALAASAIPAWRAARTNPARTLREE